MRAFPLVVVALAGCAGLTASRAPRERQAAAEGAAPASPSLAASREASCASCHAREAEEWRTSLHHASFSDGDFQKSFAAEPLDFCFGCHAPLAKDRADRHGTDLGVGCASCHPGVHGAASGNVAAATGTDVNRGAHGPGGGRGAASCNPCHQFSFPDRAELMQKTVDEHQKASMGKSCVECHMSPRPGGRDHTFRTSRDADLLRRSLAVDEARLTKDSVELTLRTVDVGHAFPTGDLFRRILVRVWTENGEGAITSDAEIVLGRRFEHRPGGLGAAMERSDDRILGSRHITVPVPPGAARAAVRIRYDRVAVDAPQRLAIFGSTPLFERDLQPEATPKR
jgi:hypothetical protein